MQLNDITLQQAWLLLLPLGSWTTNLPSWQHVVRLTMLEHVISKEDWVMVEP